MLSDPLRMQTSIKCRKYQVFDSRPISQRETFHLSLNGSFSIHPLSTPASSFSGLRGAWGYPSRNHLDRVTGQSQGRTETNQPISGHVSGKPRLLEKTPCGNSWTGNILAVRQRCKPLHHYAARQPLNTQKNLKHRKDGATLSLGVYWVDMW